MSNVVFKGEPVISSNDLATLKDIAQNFDEPARICFHDSEASDLHLMLISLKPCLEYPVHRHLDGDECLILMQGELSVDLYDHAFNLEKHIYISPLSSKESDELAILLKKNQWHSVKSGSEGATFIEVKPGPFDKTMIEFKKQVDAEMSNG